jgi:flagellar motor switch protein FliM
MAKRGPRATNPPQAPPEADVPPGAELIIRPAEGGAPTSGAVGEPWDFRQTTRFSAEVLRGFRRLFDHWGPLMQTALPPSTRMPVEIGDLKMDPLSYEAYARSPVDFGVLGVVEEASGLLGPILLRLDEGLALVLLDRELGGAGVPMERTRPFSSLELSVMRGPLEMVTRLLEEIFRLQMPEANLTLDRVDGANQLQNIAPPTEAVLWVQQALTLNGVAGRVHVVLPYASIESALTLLVTGQRGDMPTDVGQAVLKPFVGLRHVRAEARLGPVVLTAEQVAGLRPGDVVALNVRVGQGFWMTVEGRPAFLVHDIGRVGLRTAVRVAQKLPASLLERFKAEGEGTR